MDIQTIVLAILGSSVISTLINQVFNHLEQRNRRDKIDRLLLLDALKRQGAEYIANKHLSMKELESFNEYYKWYKDLGGDGFADEIKRRVQNLSIMEESTK